MKILHKRLHFHAYRVQILQALKPEDKPRPAEFATLTLERIDADIDYFNKVCFSDEATFHTSGNVNRHNVRIWGSENPHVVLQHMHILKVQIWHVVETVTEEMLANTWREIEYCLDVLRATNGAHIEVYP